MPDFFIALHVDDNVLVARQAAPKGTSFNGAVCCTREDIPFGHKVARTTISAGAPVVKYGQVIGFAHGVIQAGQHVHTHNVTIKDFTRRPAASAAPILEAPDEALADTTFRGIVRASGQVATRNYLGVISTVNCSASVVRMAARAMEAHLRDQYPAVDGVVPLCHGQGCDGATEGPAFDNLLHSICGYARHPNFAGVVIIGLGCEIMRLETIMEQLSAGVDKPLHGFCIQDVGGSAAAVDKAVDLLKNMLPAAADVARRDVPLHRLKLGLQCGGSDACSGISANPALGAAVDRLIQAGAAVVMGETPEAFGAEHLLYRRAVRPAVAEKLADRLEWWRRYAADHGVALDNNPSPGNRAGGLTNIIEKSLGAVAKGGSTPLTAVLDYARPIAGPGLQMMDSPGYDPSSITGMIAGGAHLICFTTGRGSVLGTKPAPVIKLATHTDLYRRMQKDMDVNCGTIIDGTADVDQVGQKILDTIIAAASGEKTKSERAGMGDDEFVPWHLGAVL